MLEQLLEANVSSASAFALADLPRRPRLPVAIVTCMDARLDPLRIFGLEPGDVVVLRNAGARVTEDVLRSLSLAVHLLDVGSVALLQHTQCALAGVEEEALAALIARQGARVPGELLAMADPDAALRSDVDRIGASGLFPADLRTEGWRYDVAGGSVTRLYPG